LSVFVLVSQNRQAEITERQAELDLQINLLAEHEITRILTIVDALASHLKVKVDSGEIAELEQDVRPEAVLRAIDQTDGKTNKDGKKAPAKSAKDESR
jgi:uncharacterized membrane protein